jgi:hypothetical protein
MRWLKVVAVLGFVTAAGFAACAPATAASVELWTDVPCKDMQVYLFEGTTLEGTGATRERARSGSEQARAVVSDTDGRTCVSLGDPKGNPFYKLADLTLSPKNKVQQPAAVVAIVAKRGRSLKWCAGELRANSKSADCMEIAATFDYVEHETRRIILRLSQDCFGIACGPNTTCVANKCVSAVAELGGNGGVPTVRADAGLDASSVVDANSAVDVGTPDPPTDAGTPQTLANLKCENGKLGSLCADSTPVCLNKSASSYSCLPASSCALPLRQACCVASENCCLTSGPAAPTGVEFPFVQVGCGSRAAEFDRACFAQKGCDLQGKTYCAYDSTRGFGRCVLPPVTSNDGGAIVIEGGVVDRPPPP